MASSHIDEEPKTNEPALRLSTLTRRTSRPELRNDVSSENRAGGRDDDEVKAESDSSSLASAEKQGEEKTRWRYKGTALACVLFFTLGSNWAASAISPLKSTIREELDITNAQYGIVASANNLVNTILPVFGGIAIDYYGPEIGSLVSSLFNMVGALIAAIGASRGSYHMLVGGQIILGLGTTTIETAQSKLYTHWFYGSHLGFVYGLDVAAGRVMNLVAKATSVPIAENTGNWVWSFWVSFIMCAATLGLNAFYYLFALRLPEKLKTPTRRGTHARTVSSAGEGRKRWWWLTSVFCIPASYWIVLVTQIFQSGTVGAYMNVAPDVISQTRNTTAVIAGFNASLEQLVAIVVTPCLGLILDRFGRRMYFVPFTAMLYLLAMSLMGYTTLHAAIPTALSALGLAFNSLPFLASIPLLVKEQQYMGTAFGLWTAFDNSGQVIMDVSAGVIQDKTPGESYHRVFIFFLAMKAIQFFLGFFYNFMDRRYFGSILRMSEAERKRKDAEDEELRVGGGKLERWQRLATYVGLATLSTMIVASFVVYLKYA